MRFAHSTAYGVLQDLEKAKPKLKGAREKAEALRVRVEVDAVLSLLDDLDNGAISREEAHVRARKLGLVQTKKEALT